MYTLDEPVYTRNNVIFATKTTIKGFEVYAVILLDEYEKIVEVKTYFSAEEAITKLNRIIRNMEYANVG